MGFYSVVQLTNLADFMHVPIIAGKFNESSICQDIMICMGVSKYL